MMINKDISKDLILSTISKAPPMASLQLDPDKYRSGLKEFNLTPEQENELLSTLWKIMTTIVNISFGVDSTQLATPTLLEKLAADSGNTVQLIDYKKTYNQQATQSMSKEVDYDEHK